MPPPVLFDLRGLASPCGDHGTRMSAFDEFAVQFDRTALDAALIQFRK